MSRKKSYKEVSVTDQLDGDPVCLYDTPNWLLSRFWPKLGPGPERTAQVGPGAGTNVPNINKIVRPTLRHQN